MEQGAKVKGEGSRMIAMEIGEERNRVEGKDDTGDKEMHCNRDDHSSNVASAVDDTCKELMP